MVCASVLATQPGVPQQPEPEPQTPEPGQPAPPSRPQPVEVPERKYYPIHRDIPEEPIHPPTSLEMTTGEKERGP